MKKTPIYLFSDKISYKTFKKVMDKFPQGTIVPMNIDRILWELLKKRQLYVYLDNKSDDPVCLSLKLPKGRKVSLLENPIKTPHRAL